MEMKLDKKEGLKLLESIQQNEVFTVQSIREDPKDRETMRCMKWEDNVDIFMFNRRSKKFGHTLTPNQFMDLYDINTITFPNSIRSRMTLWAKRVRSTRDSLTKYDLWPELRNVLDLIIEHNLTLLDINQISDWYWCFNNPAITKSEEEYKAMKKANIERCYEKYPYFIYLDKHGNKCINGDAASECVQYMKLKSMYFGRHNAIEKESITKHLNEKTEYSTTAYANYDVRFEYKPDKKRAWYSEEYKGCGNGHYYLAISPSTALFSEDD